MKALTKKQAYALFEDGQPELERHFREALDEGRSWVRFTRDGSQEEPPELYPWENGTFVLVGQGSFYEELVRKATEPASPLAGAFR